MFRLPEFQRYEIPLFTQIDANGNEINRVWRPKSEIMQSNDAERISNGSPQISAANGFSQVSVADGFPQISVADGSSYVNVANGSSQIGIDTSPRDEHLV